MTLYIYIYIYIYIIYIYIYDTHRSPVSLLHITELLVSFFGGGVLVGMSHTFGDLIQLKALYRSSLRPHTAVAYGFMHTGLGTADAAGGHVAYLCLT